MSAQARYRQIYADKIMEQGGLYSGGGRRRRRAGVALQGGRRRIGGGSHNPWVQFLHQWAAKHRMTYGEALKDPRASKAYHGGRY